MPFQIRPNRTVVTSFTGQSNGVSSQVKDYDDGLYVLHTSCDNSTNGHAASSCVSCALSDGSLQLYSVDQLRCIGSIPNVHDNKMISDLCQLDANQLMSSGMDGTVKLFDARTSSNAAPVMTMTLPKSEQALSVSCGYGNTLAAVGSHKSNIHFYDMRRPSNTNASNTNAALLGSYVDAHTEEVTKVRFHPTNQKLLVSGSEDGLVCLFDTQQASEEAALMSVCNVQSSIRQVGYFAQQHDGLYVLTGSESMSLWHGPSAQRLVDFSSTCNLRQQLSQQANMEIHYFVDAYNNTTNNLLQLVAGNDDGNVAIFAVSPTNIILTHTLIGGHKGVVRSISWPSPSTCITAGEDARLVEWNLHPTTTTTTTTSSHSSTRSAPHLGGGPTRRHPSKKSSSNNRKKNSHNPY